MRVFTLGRKFNVITALTGAMLYNSSYTELNVTGENQGLDAILELSRLFSRKVKDLHYEVESQEFFAGGFVQRCRITGELESEDALTSQRLTHLFECQTLGDPGHL